MKQKAGRIFDLIIKCELLLLAAGIPVLVLPRSYLWKWQQGLSAYAPVGDEAAPGLSPLTWAALALVALPWLLRLVRQGRLSQRTPLDWPIALTLLSAAIGLWPSVDPLFSLERFLGLVAGVALYYGLVNSINTERQLGWLLALFLAGGAALALLGFAQTDWTAVNSPLAAVLAPVYRALAGLPKLGPKRLNVSVLAGTLIIFVPLALCLLLAPIRRRYKPLLALVALLAGGYAVLGWSDGDLLALALTLLLLPAFRVLCRGAEGQRSRGAGEQRGRGAEEQGSRGAGERGSKGAEGTFSPAPPPPGTSAQKGSPVLPSPTSPSGLGGTEGGRRGGLGGRGPSVHLRVLAIIILALLTLAILLTFQPSNLPTSNLQPPTSNFQPPTSSLLTQLRPSRWQVWTRALLMIRDYPFTGIGLDTFRLVAQNEYPYFNYAFNQTEHPHNLFLQAGVDQGVLGLLALLWLIIAFYRTVGKSQTCPERSRRIANRKPVLSSAEGSQIAAKSQDQSPITAHWSLITGLSAGFTAFLIGSLFDNGVMTSHRTALVVWAVLGLQVANRKSQIANRESRITSHVSPLRLSLRQAQGFGSGHGFTFYVLRFPRHALLPMAGIIILLIAAYLSYPIVSSAYYDNLGCVERGRGWLWREASEEQRRAYARSALAHFQRALVLWPGNAAAQRHLGTLYFHAQHPEEAVARLQGMPGAGYHPGFLAFYDEVAKVMGAEAPLPHISVNPSINSGRRSMQCLEQAVALAPYDFLAHFFLAEAYRADGRVAEAADQYAAAGVPLDRVLWDAGRRCRGNPSTEEAIVEYEIAAQLDPHNAFCQVKLGDLYRDAGRAEEARAAYETALTLRPDDEYVRQQLAQLP